MCNEPEYGGKLSSAREAGADVSTQIEVIGGVRAIVDGDPIRLRRQVQRLVAILVAAGPNGIEASALAEELWLGAPPQRWSSAIRNALATLRRATRPDIVITSASRYSLACDINDVDAWRLLDASRDRELDFRRVGRVGRFLPFDGLELTPMLREMTEALHAARLQLVDRIETPADIDAEMLAGLVAAVRDDPFAEPVAVAVVRLLLRLERSAEADDLLDHIEAAGRSDIGAELPPLLAELRAHATRTDARSRPARRSPESRSLPSVVADLTQRPMTERRRRLAAALADDITQHRVARRLAVVGLAGSGKSRFVAETARQLHDNGNTVVYADAVGDETTAYGALLTASPAFRRRFLDIDSSDESSVWALWSSIVDDLGSHGRPITLVVDDAQWLDRGSIRLLEFTHRMETTTPITTIVVARPNAGEPDWARFETELRADPGTEPFEVPTLDAEEIAELIRSRWPNRPAVVYRDTSADVLEASGGLPLVATLIIEGLSGPTLLRPDRLTGRHLDIVTARLRQLDPATLQTLAAASVIGATFNADDIAVVLERNPFDIDEALEDAVQAAVIIDLETPGAYRFAHDLLRSGAAAVVDRSTLASWSARYLDHVDDPIRLAHLAFAGRSVLEPAEVGEHTVAGAESALERGLLRIAVTFAERALQLGDGVELDTSVEHRALCCLALAQVRLGALDEAAASRAQMLDHTCRSADHGRAARVLIDSVAIVEIDQPTSITVADVDRLDVRALDEPLRFERSLAIARLATWQGDRARRDAELAAARSVARSSAEFARLFYSEWRCDTHTIDDGWFDDVGQAVAKTDDGIAVADLELARALELAAFARWEQAEAAAVPVQHRTGATAEQRWLARLAVTAFAIGRGDLVEAECLADDAYRHGLLFDLPLAPAARMAHAFNIALCSGTTDQWLQAAEPQPQLFRATLALAALGRARFEVGRVGEAWETIEPVIETTLSGQPRLAASTIAVMAPLLRRKAPPSVRQRASDLLRAHGERWLISGSGVGIHGPATRVLAVLEGNRRELVAVRRSLEATPVWSGVIDRDIATLDQER